MAGGAIEDLHRHGLGRCTARSQHFGMVETGGGLHQRVKTAPRGPGAPVPIGRQRHTHDAGPFGGELRCALPQRRQCPRAVTLHKHMRLRHQGVQRSLARGRAQIDMAGEFAPAGVGNGLDVGQLRRVHQQHVGTIRGQRAPAHRAGQNAGEVKHPQVCQWRFACLHGRQLKRRRFANFLKIHQWLGGNGLALRVRVPFVEGPHSRHHQAGLRGGFFKRQRLPIRHAGPGLLTGGGGRVQAHDPQGTFAVVQKVGMDAHKTVAAGIQAGKLVPNLGNPAIQAEPVGAFHGRVRHVDSQALARQAARMAQLTRRQRRCRDAGLRCCANREG